MPFEEKQKEDTGLADKTQCSIWGAPGRPAGRLTWPHYAELAKPRG